MKRILRGHHILCVHGFQGMGYSPNFVKNMTEIVKSMRNEELAFPVQVANGFDEVCRVCPHKGESGCEASQDSDAHAKELDRRVINHLGLDADEVYDKEQLVRLTAEKVRPDDLDMLCAGCSWLPYGVCKEGIARLNRKYGFS